MKFKPSEKLLIEEIREKGTLLKKAIRGLSIGKLIRLIRMHLGLSQVALAKRAGVPQSTISRIEKEERDVNLSTLQKVLGALSCDLVIAPVLQNSIEVIRARQAKKKAKKQVDYLRGTMNLEKQQPDPRFIEELLKHEEDELLHGSNAKLWED